MAALGPAWIVTLSAHDRIMLKNEDQTALELRLERLRTVNPEAHASIGRMVDEMTAGGTVHCPLCGHEAPDTDGLCAHVAVDHPKARSVTAPCA